MRLRATDEPPLPFNAHLPFGCVYVLARRFFSESTSELCASPSNLISSGSPIYTRDGLILELVLYWTESHPQGAYHRKRTEQTAPDEGAETLRMMEITAIGMGLVMTGVAVAVGGVLLEATLMMMCRALRTPTLAASFEPTAINLS